MMLYFFNPNDYGEGYYTVAYSQQDALESLKLYLKEQMEHPDNIEHGSYKAEYEKWEGASVDNLPDQFSIDEYKIGQVAEGYNG